MKQAVNEVYQPLFTTDKRYIIILGGRGAGRSTVASQRANAKLVAPEYYRCAIMRYILGDIRNSIYREITDRAEENGIDEKLKINSSTMSIEYGLNSINAVGFRKSSSDQKSKLKSLASYNCIIIEEADEIPEDDFNQLDDSLRTIKGDIKIILLLNPPAKNHWIIQRWFDLQKCEDVKDFYIPIPKDKSDSLCIVSDYHDNEVNLAPASVVQYEAYKETKPSHYYNMIKGYIPETVKGRIYNNWRIIDSIPYEAVLIRRGLDFGYSIDPTVIEDIYKYNGGFIVDEICYQRKLSNQAIANILLGQEKSVLTVADSSEPKSIDEISSYGVPIVGAVKGAGSVNQGIQYVQDQPISVTKRSTKTITASENYAWRVNKNSEILNVPDDKVHEWSNPMDAVRYGITDMKPDDEQYSTVTNSDAYRLDG